MKRLAPALVLGLLAASALPADDAARLALDPSGRRAARSQGSFIEITGLAGTTKDAVSFEGADPAWTADGRSLVVSRTHEGRRRLFVIAADGRRGRLLTDGSVPGDETGPSLSLAQVFFAIGSDDDADIFRVPLAGGAPVRLTRNAARDRSPAVSPDGKRIAFVSDRSGGDDIWVMAADQPFGEARRVTFNDGEDSDPAWSPDGRRIAHATIQSNERWVAVVDAKGGERQLIRRGATSPAWSSDGATIYALTAAPLPQDYNGNPRRLAESDRAPVFARGAFDLVALRAPDPLEGGRTLSGNPAATTASRFEALSSVLLKLYARASTGATAAWNDLFNRFRSRAEGAKTDAAFEDAVDDMLAERPSIKPEASSNRAVVVSAHPLATAAGLEALRRGGNVVDAIVAVSFALGVTEEDASGIGGEGMMLIHRASDGKTVAIDFKDQVPMEGTLTNPKILDGDRLVSSGPAAVNIPGVVAGMDLAYRKYGSGRLAWKDLIEPAIRAADDGFTLDEALPSSVREGQRFLKRYEAAAKIFLPGGKPIRPGDTFRNPDYAATLRRIANVGASDFYRGDIARRIAEDMRKNGGIITEEDLAQYRAIEREPLRGRYEDYDIVTAPPPVTAGVSLLQTLQILDGAPRDKRGQYTKDASAFHFMVEAWKRTGRGNLAADPALFALDLDEPLSLPWARKQFASIVAGHATPDPEYPEEPEDERDYKRERIGTGTTAAVAMDSEGNMVALTQTLSTWGGAFYVSDGLGFLYNNHLRSFRRQPKRFNSLTPLARAATGIAPTLVFKREGEKSVPMVAVGAAGNAWISSAVYQILTGVLDRGLGPQAAVEQPRFLIGRKQFPPRQPPVPSRILYEDAIPRRVVDEMRAYGHRLEPIGLKGELVMGYASVAVRDPKTGAVKGGADPRRSHVAGAIEP
ncbi:MAG: gamma-glutamyltransferase [Vicinamibacteria bacterium]|nr:gamma-glutamyltransferase [Vicinamibacteria bacterium]